jgi:hypothetical protein
VSGGLVSEIDQAPDYQSTSHFNHHPVLFTTYRGFITAAAPRSLALKRTTMSLLKSASLPGGDCVTVIGQFSN